MNVRFVPINPPPRVKSNNIYQLNIRTYEYKNRLGFYSITFSVTYSNLWRMASIQPYPCDRTDVVCLVVECANGSHRGSDWAIC